MQTEIVSSRNFNLCQILYPYLESIKSTEIRRDQFNPRDLTTPHRRESTIQFNNHGIIFLLKLRDRRLNHCKEYKYQRDIN